MKIGLKNAAGASLGHIFNLSGVFTIAYMMRRE
jgi:hypothetical protein